MANLKSLLRLAQIAFLAGTLLLAACAPDRAPTTQALLPTDTPEPTRTRAATLTPTLAPTLTPTPTRTPTATSTATVTATNTPAYTPTSTPTFTPTPLPTATPTATPVPLHPAGVIVEHEPGGEQLYRWFSYVPQRLSKDKPVYILLTGLHGDRYDYAETCRQTKMMLQERLAWPYMDRFVLLAPAIPRRDSPHVYPVAFDVVSFYEADPLYARADLKVNLMIDDLARVLEKDGYRVADQVMIEGFSAGGMFAQRYALLHPNRVRALAAGQCGGHFVLPETTYQGTALNWPAGVNNLGALAGLSFDSASYKKIAQFIYIGELDSGAGGTTTVWPADWGPQDMWESVEQLEFVRSQFGQPDPARLRFEIDYLNSLGYDKIGLTVYPGLAHEYTREVIEDYMSFLVQNAR